MKKEQIDHPRFLASRIIRDIFKEDISAKGFTITGRERLKAARTAYAFIMSEMGCHEYVIRKALPIMNDLQEYLTSCAARRLHDSDFDTKVEQALKMAKQLMETIDFNQLLKFERLPEIIKIMPRLEKDCGTTILTTVGTGHRFPESTEHPIKYPVGYMRVVGDEIQITPDFG